MNESKIVHQFNEFADMLKPLGYVKQTSVSKPSLTTLHLNVCALYLVKWNSKMCVVLDRYLILADIFKLLVLGEANLNETWAKLDFTWISMFAHLI